VLSLGPLQGRQAAFVLKYFLVERTLARAKALNTFALHLCWATWPTLGKPLKRFAQLGDVTALPLLFSARSCTRASDAVRGGSKYGDCEMSEKIKSQMISRREAFSLLGLAAALCFALPAEVLTASDAEAQATAPAPSGGTTAPAPSGGTTGMQRRQARRTGRHKRRETRRTGRHERREKRRGGGEATEKK
jgi:hypothetical protein